MTSQDKINTLLKQEHRLLDAQLSFVRGLQIQESLTSNDAWLLNIIYEEVYPNEEEVKSTW